MPRKTDLERKIEIVKFANRTRQTFIRLLALVKWAGSASKVDKCSTIIAFLDKQSMLFTDTADVLAKMARESLVQARLPSFQLPAAVEVLTLGTYSRLPTCIRERIVPPDPISAAEKSLTLQRLNQIIRQKLVSSNLPSQMRSPKIENGRVTFHSDYEFEFSLTLMGDSSNNPWRVLSVDILVMDKETGDGRDLVHPLQKTYLQDLIQSRLICNEAKPLIDSYNVLHSFCLSLQLEVLHAQAIRLSRERLGEFIKTDEYMAGRKLAILYWRDLSTADSKYLCKLVIEIDNSEQDKPLIVTHHPELGEKATISANNAIKSDHLSIEKLLIHTVHERAKQSLTKLKASLDEVNVGETSLSGCPPLLELCFMPSCMQSERMLVSVDHLTGIYLAHIPQFEDCPLMNKFQLVINNLSKIKPWLKDLKIWILKERCKKTAEALPVHVSDNLPSLPNKQHSIISCTAQKLFFQFSKHHNKYLMVTFEESVSTNELEQKYYLLSATTSSLETGDQPVDSELTKSFVHVTSFLQLDMLSLFNPRSRSDYLLVGNKRKLVAQDDNQSKRKASSFVSNLAYLVSFCEEKLTYGALSSELQGRGICHQIRVTNEPGFTHMIDIIQFLPTCSTSYLQRDLLNSTLRLQSGKSSKNLIWTVALCFCNCPVQTLLPKESSVKRMVYLMYDFSNGSKAQIVQMVDELLEDWSALEKLYEVVYEFGKVASSFINIVDIKSFTYKKLFLNYGPNKSYLVSISWKSQEKRFQLNFGVTGMGPSNGNPHVMTAAQLQQEFNQHRSIATLIQTLNTTFAPLLTIYCLTSVPLLGVINSRPQVPKQTFVAIPQTSAHLRLLYRSTYCLDIVFQSDGLIAIRDGAYSLFDKGKALEELTPIQGLKAFLSKFVDKSATQMRRHSQTEDDNPPSPISQDPIDSYMFTSMKTASPSVSDNLNVRHNLNSNPNTPASPHTSMMSQMHPSPSMPQGHPDQSPATLFGVNSPMNSLHAPSPSFLPTPSPGPSTHMQSPAPNFMGQGHDPSQVHSPFQTHGMSMTSPGAAAWPGSPSIPRPSPSRPSLGSMQSPASCGQPLGIGQSPQTPNPHLNTTPQSHASFATAATRHLPQKSWAAAVPTLLTNQGLDNMCKASHFDTQIGQQLYGAINSSLSQLERFLGCVSVRRHLQRVISQDEAVSKTI